MPNRLKVAYVCFLLYTCTIVIELSLVCSGGPLWPVERRMYSLDFAE